VNNHLPSKREGSTASCPQRLTLLDAHSGYKVAGRFDKAYNRRAWWGNYRITHHVAFWSYEG